MYLAMPRIGLCGGCRTLFVGRAYDLNSKRETLQRKYASVQTSFCVKVMGT